MQARLTARRKLAPAYFFQMGLLAIYVTASAEEASRIDLASGPSFDLGPVDGPVLMPTDLERLAEHLGCGLPGITVFANTGEAWLIQLGESFAQALADLPATIGDEIADKYSLSAGDIDALESVLHPLAEAAVKLPGRAVYEWISL